MFEIGELRNQLSLDLQRRLETVRNHWAAAPNYFLLIHSNRFDENADYTRIIRIRVPEGWPREKLPIPRMLGTILLYVDNRKGAVEYVWNLPFDLPRDPETISEETVRKVVESAKDMPVVY